MNLDTCFEACLIVEMSHPGRGDVLPPISGDRPRPCYQHPQSV